MPKTKGLVQPAAALAALLSVLLFAPMGALPQPATLVRYPNTVTGSSSATNSLTGFAGLRQRATFMVGGSDPAYPEASLWSRDGTTASSSIVRTFRQSEEDDFTGSDSPVILGDTACFVGVDAEHGHER